MTNKKLSQQQKEETLSQYIDALNDERRPDVSAASDEQDIDELMDLFETVRAVRRTRPETGKGVREPMNKTRRKPGRAGSFGRRLVAMAATVALLLGGALVWQQLQEDPLDPRNIAFGMLEQYENLESFQGEIEREIVDEQEGVTYQETIEVLFRQPNHFYAVHHWPGGTTEKLYTGGDTLTEVDRDGRLTLRTVTEEMLAYELQEYRMDTEIRERLSQVADVRLVAEEQVAGRDAQVYLFTYADSDSEHRVWVDKATGISLREVYDSGRGLRIDTRFVTFEEGVDVTFPELSPAGDEEINDERITDEQRQEEQERVRTLEELQEGDVIAVTFQGMADSNFGEFGLGDQFVVMGVDESLQEEFLTMEPGVRLEVEIGFETWTTNPVIRAIVRR